MKPAKEWMIHINNLIHCMNETCRADEVDIRAIQSDAYRAGLLRAAELCREIMKANPYPTERISQIDMIQAIEREARKERHE